jgi:hypothetical protein
MYSKTTENKYMPDGFGAGQTTDDTQLSIAMANSIVKVSLRRYQ